MLQKKTNTMAIAHNVAARRAGLVDATSVATSSRNVCAGGGRAGRRRRGSSGAACSNPEHASRGLGHAATATTHTPNGRRRWRDARTPSHASHGATDCGNEDMCRRMCAGPTQHRTSG